MLSSKKYELVYDKESKNYIFYCDDNLIEVMQKVDHMTTCLDEWVGGWKAYTRQDNFKYTIWEIKSVD